MLAVFVIGAGLTKIWLRRQLRNRGIKVQGTIIALEVSYSSENKRLWHPVFQYTTLDNEVVTHRSALGYSPCPYSEGDSIFILYDSTEKDNFIVDSFWGDFVGYAITLVGVILLIAFLQ
ncbi:DUF3592 domain-containing protein [Mucilaginibacter sp.]